MEKTTHKNFFNLFWNLLWFTLLIFIILRIAVFQQVNVVGVSMEPNYYQNEQLLINQIQNNINRGQVVAVYRDKEIAKNANYFTRFRAVFYLKRVIGLPNEEVEILDGKVIIYNDQYPQGAVLQEDYIVRDAVAERHFPKTKIPEDEYFLLGDNRNNSQDSRKTGTFARYAILGTESFKFLPLVEARSFDLPDYKYRDLSEAENLQLERYRS